MGNQFRVGGPVEIAVKEKKTVQRTHLIFLCREDRDRLNRFVMESVHGHFRQLYEWGQVLAYDGTKTVHLGVEREGMLCASLALCIRRIPGTPLTFLTGLRGPVLDLKDWEALDLLVNGVKAVAHSQKAVFFRMDPDYTDAEMEIRQLLLEQGFVHLRQDWSSLCDPRIVMRVDLRPSEVELLEQMRKKHRQHIRGIEKRGLTIRTARDQTDMNRFAYLMMAQGQEKRFAVRGERYFQALWNHFIQTRFGELFIVEQNGEMCGGGLAVICGQKSWFMYTANTPQARQFFPGEPIYWEVMRWAKSRGAQVCDFGGTGTGWPPMPDTSGYSLYFFKLGFNAQPFYLTGYYDLIFRPSLYRILRFAEDHLLERWLKLLNFLPGRSR